MKKQKIIQAIVVTGVVLLLAGCNRKKSHFEDGGNLLCTENNLFSDDAIRTVNSENAYLGTKYGAHGSAKTIVTLNGGSMFNRTSFNIDNCKIK
jgi:hypothetical protein